MRTDIFNNVINDRSGLYKEGLPAREAREDDHGYCLVTVDRYAILF
jgi:hypothetical protein